MTAHAMQTTGLISFLVIGLLAGWIASKMMRGTSLGLPANLAVGVVGAVIGGYLFRLAGVAVGGFVGSLITAVVGALILLYVVGLLRKG